MNWLDIVMLIMIGASSFIGWRVGITSAVFTVVGLILGVYLAIQFSGDIAEILTDTISSKTLATVISYGLIFAVVVIVSRILGGMIRKILRTLFLGWVDGLGGLALGLVGGAIIAGALMLGLARYAYNFELPSKGITGQAISQLERIEVKDNVQNALTNSTLVPIFLDLRDALPGNATVFIPKDFTVALDILDNAVENKS